MPTFAIARLENVRMGPEIVQYLERIDATLAPFGGRFRVHGGPYEVVEGSWSGDVVVLEFPDRRAARSWYESPAYRDILPLRTEHASSDVIFIDTVAEDHRATDILGG
jgi:uncharacterized protein (DUF1330 family)